MCHGTVIGLRPKNQVLEVGAFTAWILSTAAVGSQVGLDLRSGGLPLIMLAGAVALFYLTGGKDVDVDCASNLVRARWRFAGLPLGSTETPMQIRRLELRPEWMTRIHGDSVDHKGTMVYDLGLVGAPRGTSDGDETVIDLKKNQLFFGLSERRSQEMARTLGLPLAIRWDRLFPDIRATERQYGEWTDPIAYPPELGDWRRWL